MTAPTHIITGLASVVVVGHATGITPSAPSLLAMLVGTLAPDIDGNGSITRPGTILRQLIGRDLGEILDAIFEVITFFIHLVFTHRGFLHAPIVAFGLLAAGSYLGSSALFWFGFGYLIHVLGDFMTPDGIPLLAPIFPHGFSLNVISTGSLSEGGLALGSLGFVCIYGWPLLPDAVRHTHEQLYRMVMPSL